MWLLKAKFTEGELHTYSLERDGACLLALGVLDGARHPADVWERRQGEVRDGRPQPPRSPGCMPQR